MKVKRIKLLNSMCACGGCPAVFEIVGENKLVIVGLKADRKAFNLSGKIGDNEEAIVVDKEMLEKIFNK